jgi:phenylacetate-CoA ligase
MRKSPMSLRELLLSRPYFEKKKILRETEFLSAEKLHQIQAESLLRVINHAVTNVPYYRKRIDFSEIRTSASPFELIKGFPVIDKDCIRKHINEFLWGSKIRRIRATTGGSTGQPFLFYVDRFSTRQIEKAFMFDQWRRVGYKLGDRIFSLRGRIPNKNRFVKQDRFFNIYFASSFNLNFATLKQYVDEINRIEPKYLHGYPSTIYQLASLMDGACLKLKRSPKAILCGSERLFIYQRELIEKVFFSRVYSWYGHSECLVLGGECENSNSLHIYPQYGYTELFPTGTKNAYGKEIYEIVATGFNNYIMPLIRYRTGDYAVLYDNQRCNCGRNYLLFDEVIGREQEFVVDRHGELVSATSLIFGQHFPVFAGLDGLYLEQHVPGELKILMKKNKAFNDNDFSQMKSRITAILGNRFKVTYEFTDEIPRSSIGKAKLVKQQLNVDRFFQTKGQERY